MLTKKEQEEARKNFVDWCFENPNLYQEYKGFFALEAWLEQERKIKMLSKEVDKIKKMVDKHVKKKKGGKK